LGVISDFFLCILCALLLMIRFSVFLAAQHFFFRFFPSDFGFQLIPKTLLASAMPAAGRPVLTGGDAGSARISWRQRKAWPSRAKFFGYRAVKLLGMERGRPH